MADEEVRTTPERSLLMQRVRRRGTTPELKVRQILTELGARYRLNVEGLPGSPDIANARWKKAIFVHGCFWHFHQACGRGRIPERNRTFWTGKLEKNVERDQRKIDALRARGYDVLVVWECELRSYDALRERLREYWYNNA